MATLRLPYVVQIRVKGHRYTYFRRPGVRVRLPDPSDPTFLPAYQSAAAGTQPGPAAPRAGAPAAGSLAALVLAYRASPKWRELAPATRGNYNKALTLFEGKFGHLPVVHIPRNWVFGLRDKYAVNGAGEPTPRKANQIIAVLGLLMSWAIDRGWRKDNPARKPGRLKTGPGFLTWTPSNFATFMACEGAPPELKLAAALGWHTGQRAQDCLALTRLDIQAAGARVVQMKTGAEVWIPIRPELAALLASGPLPPPLRLLTRPDGQPWQRSHFDHAFARAVKTAGLDGLTFHGLRKGAAANLAEHGASASEVQAVTGHRTLAEVTRYTAAADQKRRARAAMKRLES